MGRVIAWLTNTWIYQQIRWHGDFKDYDPTWDWDEESQTYVERGTVGELRAHTKDVQERYERATTYREKYEIWAEEGIFDGVLLALARKEESTTQEEGSK